MRLRDIPTLMGGVALLSIGGVALAALFAGRSLSVPQAIAAALTLPCIVAAALAVALARDARGSVMVSLSTGSTHLLLSRRTTVDDLRRIVGPPSEQWDDGVEASLEYQLGGWRTRFLFAVAGDSRRLRGLEIEQGSGACGTARA